MLTFPKEYRDVQLSGDQLLLPWYGQYRNDSKRIEELREQDTIRFLIHGYGAIKQNEQWVIHPLGEQTLQAAVLLFKTMLNSRPNCRINVLMGGDIPYGEHTLGQLGSQRLQQLIHENTLPSQNITIFDISQTGEPLSRGFSTSGELDCAKNVFGMHLFYAIAPSPHIPRIFQLILHKNIQGAPISIDGIFYILGDYEKIKPLIRKHWLKFILYEAVMNFIVRTVDHTGTYFEIVARFLRSKYPPPTF